MPNYLLDACALIAFFDDEEGAALVEDLLNKAKRKEITLCMNVVNLVEVYYDRIRVTTLERADEKIKWIYGIPVKIIEANDPALIREAAILKSAGEMSLADTFLVATAKCTGATLVTADWEELEKVAREGQIPFCWIRPKPAKSLK